MFNGFLKEKSEIFHEGFTFKIGYWRAFKKTVDVVILIYRALFALCGQ